MNIDTVAIFIKNSLATVDGIINSMERRQPICTIKPEVVYLC